MFFRSSALIPPPSPGPVVGEEPLTVSAGSEEVEGEELGVVELAAVVAILFFSLCKKVGFGLQKVGGSFKQRIKNKI